MGQRESQPWAQCMCATQNTGQSKVTKHLMNEMFENYRVPKVAKVAKVARAAGGEPTTTTPKTLDDEMFEN